MKHIAQTTHLYEGDGQRAEDRLKMIAWCLAGRRKQHRAKMDDKENSPRFIEWPTLEVKPETEFYQNLQALKESSWVLDLDNISELESS